MNDIIESDSILNSIEAYEWQQRHELRLHRCGQVLSYTDPTTNVLKRARYRCNCWRECRACFDLRVAAIERRLAHIFHFGEIHEVVLTDYRDLDRLRRKYKAAAYFACPQSAGVVVYLLTTDNIGQVVTEPSYPISTLALTPVGRNLSGKLGKSCTDQPTGTRLRVTGFTCDAEPITLLESYFETLTTSTDLRPTTVAEVERDYALFQSRLRQSLTARGVTDFRLISMTLILHEERLNWSPSEFYLASLRRDIDRLRPKQLLKTG